MGLYFRFWFFICQRTSALLSLVGCLLISRSFVCAQPAPSDRVTESRRILRLALERAVLVEDAVLQVQMRCHIAEAQSQIGDKVDAKATYLDVLPLALEHQEDDYCLRELDHMARWLAVEKDVTGAMQILALTKSEGVQQRVLSDMAIAQGHANQFAAALDTAEKMADANVEWISSTYAQIALSMGKAGRKEAADKTFAISMRQANNIEDAKRKQIMLSEIIRARAEVGENAEARALAETLRGSDLYERALCEIASAQAEAGDPNGALALLTKTNAKDMSSSDFALLAVAVQYSKRKELDTGLRVVERIKDMRWRVLALRLMGEELLRKGNLSQARTITGLEQSLAPKIQDVEERISAYLLLAEQQEETKQRNQGIATLALVPPLVLKVAQEERRDYLKERFSGAQALLGQVQEALQTAQALPAIKGRGRALHRIASIRMRLEAVNTVRLWCESLPSVYEQTEGLLGIVDGLRAGGNSQTQKN